MYYLLENNKIIDSRISYTANFPYWEIKDNCLFAKSKNDKFVRPYNENKIKKQSENVFDLIEIGQDLVRVKGNSHNCNENIYRVVEICFLSGLIGFSVLGFALVKTEFDNVLAIYKPDSEGNYIKVWEVKDDI